jgi:dihydroflavonol-4-reductase
MPDRVLVTGATGFIAGHCVTELLEHGYAVRGTVRNLATADVAHLRAVAGRTGGEFELAQATLDDDAGWADAVAGCAYVWHVASPNPPAEPKDAEAEVITPAVQGALRVLRAAAAGGTVRRVVMTSSVAAVSEGGERDPGRVHTEADWSDVDGAVAYPRSKTLAEQAAWDYVGGTDLELITINPGLVLGPLLRKEETTSIETVRLLLGRKVPGTPHVGFAIVDVRDVARAHRLAMETPAAAGNRYIVAGEHRWMNYIARTLATTYGPRGYRIPTRELPYWLLWTVARFDKTVRLVLPMVGRYANYSTAKAETELGWTRRPPEESIVDTAESLLRHGVVPRQPGDKQPTPAPA